MPCKNLIGYSKPILPFGQGALPRKLSRKQIYLSTKIFQKLSFVEISSGCAYFFLDLLVH